MSEKMTAAQRVAPYELAMFRSADPTVDGALVGAPTRAVPRKDAIRACEEHAAAAVAEVTMERDDAQADIRRMGEALIAATRERDEARADLDGALRRLDALQRAQRDMRDPERRMVCDILANGRLRAEGYGGEVQP